jgi:hypothetical protein
MAICELATRRPGRLRAPGAVVEIVLLALLYVGYSAARMIGDADLSAAMAHAHDLLDLERMLHLDIELWANQALQSVPALALASSYWYALLHYVVTPAVLVWAYRSHRGHYRRVRDALVVGSAIGLIGFTLLPMAPPRMLSGYVDTLAATAGSGWWSTDASARKGLGSLTNELAAMPSLHVGWAMWCAWVVIGLSRNRHLRVAVVAYAVGTTLVVVATANHFVLDAVAGVAVMALAIRLARVTSRRRSDADPGQHEQLAAFPQHGLLPVGVTYVEDSDAQDDEAA